MGATQVAQWHGSALGAEFDHSPMAPPIVHPSNGVNHCRTSSGSRHPRKRVGTAEAGLGGNLGLRVTDLGV